MHCISPHGPSLHHTIPHSPCSLRTSLHRTSLRRTSQHRTSLHNALLHCIGPHRTSLHCIGTCITSPHCTNPHCIGILCLAAHCTIPPFSACAAPGTDTLGHRGVRCRELRSCSGVGVAVDPSAPLPVPIGPIPEAAVSPIARHAPSSAPIRPEPSAIPILGTCPQVVVERERSKCAGSGAASVVTAAPCSSCPVPATSTSDVASCIASARRASLRSAPSAAAPRAPR